MAIPTIPNVTPILTVFLFTLLIAGGILLLGFAIYRKVIWGKYICYIVEKDVNGNTIMKQDNGREMKGKHGYGFYLKKNKHRLDTKNLRYVTLENRVFHKRIAYLLRNGKNLAFMNSQITGEDILFEVTEQDYNWAEDATKEGDKLTGGSEFWKAVIGYAIFIIPMLFAIILLVITYQQLGELVDVIVPLVKQGLSANIIQ